MDEFKVPAVSVRPAASQKTTNISHPDINEPPSFKKPPSEKAPSKPAAPSDAKCPYREPKWSALPNSDINYKFEVLKAGSIVEEVDNLQKKAYWVFGRLEQADIVMAHPSISRFHVVLQYRPTLKPDAENDEEPDDETNDTKTDSKFGEGWYLYDLGSANGTFLNKMPVPPKTYIPVRVGHMITLGASSRKYILQGPDFDEEPESELTVTELKEKRARDEEEKQKKAEIQAELREKEGVSWGMAEDADEETDLTVNPYASTNNEELFLDDPKKTLRGFFEREGYDLEYKADELSPGTFICRVELPIDDANGKPIVAEVCHKGKKKECVLQCALEACRILDRHGVLRQSHHEPMKRRAPKNDSDDEDDFFDRTGDIERKKKRKEQAGQSHALTYDELIKQEAELSERMASVKKKMVRYQEESKRSKESATQNEDDLDDYMKNLSHGKEMDKTEIRKLRVEEQRLLGEHQKLQRLIKIAQPTQLPSLQMGDEDNSKKKTFLPLFGKRNKSRFQLTQKPVVMKKPERKEIPSDEEEMDEDESKAAKETKHEPPTTVTSEPDSGAHEEDITSTENDESIRDDPATESGTVTQTQKDDILPARTETESAEKSPPKETSPQAIKGPAFVPPDVLQNLLKEPLSTDANESQDEDTNMDEDGNESQGDENKLESETAEEANAAKKRRNRNRNRIKGRENVDIDDKEELKEGEKYSRWVPPQNQTGDGMTSLNEKFGY